MDFNFELKGNKTKRTVIDVPDVSHEHKHKFKGETYILKPSDVKASILARYFEKLDNMSFYSACTCVGLANAAMLLRMFMV